MMAALHRTMVPETGLEPVRGFPQRFLRPQRLPFRHSGFLKGCSRLLIISLFRNNVATTDVARRVFQPLTPGPSPALRERGVLQRMLYQFGVNLCTMLPPAILQRVKRGNEIGA